MKKVFFLIFIIIFLCCLANADDENDTHLFMKYPYLQDVNILETKVDLIGSAEEILNKGIIKEYFNTTLRSRIGKPLNKLKNTESGEKSILGVIICLLGPYNDKLNIYHGYVELWLQNDGFGRMIYEKQIPVANSKTYIQQTIENSLDSLIKDFVRDYYTILDYDYSKMSESNKLLFLFNYRGKNEYYNQKKEICKLIKDDQMFRSNIFDEVSKNTQREDTGNSVIKHGLFKIGESTIVSKFIDFTKEFKRPYFICFDTNNNGLLNLKITENTTDNLFFLGIFKEGNKYYYSIEGKCDDEELVKYYSEKFTANKISKSKGASSGTGFFISNSGYIATCYHVVSGAKQITVYMPDQTPKDATLKYIDKTNDIAIIKIDNEVEDYLIVGDSLTVRQGNSVFTIGYPYPDILGNEPKYTDGSVSSLSGALDDNKYFQISVPVQSGNSGGPLANSKGEAIGIVSSKLAAEKILALKGDLPQNVNFALKSNLLRSMMIKADIATNSKKSDLGSEEAIRKTKKSIVRIIAH